MIVFGIWKCRERYPERKTETASVEKTDIQKRCEHQAHRKGMRYPESAMGIRAGLYTMAPEGCPVTRKITVFVYSRQEKDITVTCRHRIISEQDILSGEL